MKSFSNKPQELGNSQITKAPAYVQKEYRAPPKQAIKQLPRHIANQHSETTAQEKDKSQVDEPSGESSYYGSESESNENDKSEWEAYDPKQFFAEAMGNQQAAAQQQNQTPGQRAPLKSVVAGLNNNDENGEVGEIDAKYKGEEPKGILDILIPKYHQMKQKIKDKISELKTR